MVKKKGGRDINPADAFRKTQRAKEIARNKKERKFQRDAFALKAQPEQIRDELAEVLDKEEDGKVLNQTLRLKKRALQSAYDAALKKRKVGRSLAPSFLNHCPANVSLQSVACRKMTSENAPQTSCRWLTLR